MANHENPRVDSDAKSHLKSDGRILEAALTYAASGIPVFPCDPSRRKGRGKRPLVRGESTPGARDGGFHRASADPAQVRDWWARWPNALIGMPTGARSGITAVDLDPGAATADEMLEALSVAYGIENADPDTGEMLSPLLVRTQAAGLHLWFAAEPSDRNRADIFRFDQAAPAALRDGGKVDIRGEGGYIIIPPSCMADGKMYAWDGPGIEKFSALPVMPLALRQAMFAHPEQDRSPRRAVAYAPQSSDAAARRYALAALDGEARRLAAVRSGGRNDALNVAAVKLAGYAASRLLSEAMIVAALEDASTQNGLVGDDGEASVRSTIASGLAAGRLTPKVPPESSHKKPVARTQKSKPKGRSGKAVSAGNPTSTGADDQNEADADPGGRKTPRQRDALIEAANGAEFWHSPQKIAYATIEVNRHFEHWQIDSEPFKRWLAGRFYRATGGAPAGPVLSDALRVFAVRAIEDGKCYLPFIRTGFDGKYCWLDLADETWRAVRIGPLGWEIIENTSVKFLRNEVTGVLPAPEAGVMLEEFRGFVNADDDDYKLIVAWLTAALWGRARTYPVLALGGEQGSGKSTMARLLRELVDPSAVAALALPKDDREFFTQAANAHVISYDNVSKVEAWVSDAICRLATGSGFLTRKLHSDAAPYWFSGSRPIILNGIPMLAERGDLAERSLTVQLLRIDETARRSEDTWWKSWEAVRPGVLGALLDGLSAAMRRFDEVKLDKMPRMADFACLMAAAEPGLGWEEGEFAAAYESNRNAAVEDAFENDAVAVAVHKMMDDRGTRAPWQGTMSALLARLNIVVDDEMRRERYWPSKPSMLGTMIRRAAPALRHKGIAFTSPPRTSSQRIKILSWIEQG